MSALDWSITKSDGYSFNNPQYISVEDVDTDFRLLTKKAFMKKTKNRTNLFLLLILAC